MLPTVGQIVLITRSPWARWYLNLFNWKSVYSQVWNSNSHAAAALKTLDSAAVAFLISRDWNTKLLKLNTHLHLNPHNVSFLLQWSSYK